MAEVEREIGRHEEAIATLKADVAAMRTDVSEIKALLERGKGGWQTMAILGGIVAFLTESGHWVVEWIHTVVPMAGKH